MHVATFECEDFNLNFEPENGKLPERVGRKAVGLSSDSPNMVARLPGNAVYLIAVLARHKEGTVILLLSNFQRLGKNSFYYLFQIIYISFFTLTLTTFLYINDVCIAKEDFIVTQLGSNIVINPTATDPDGDTLAFSYAGWMNSSAYLTSYGDAGIHTVTVTVSDGALTDSRDVSVNVNYLSQATLTWEPNTEADLAGYKIYYGTSSGDYSSNVDAGNETFYTLSNLVSGNTYYISITAYDTSGNESTNTSELIYTVPIYSDSDGDGAPDSQEAYPNDPSKIA